MDPQYAVEYALSLQGAIWPKTAVAAGSFYRYNVSIPADELTRRIGAFTAVMSWRGLKPCACAAVDGTGEGCTPAVRCGVPYANHNSTQAPVDKCKSDDDQIHPPSPVGWLGVYHAAAGTVNDGKQTLAQDVGSWGIVAPVNAPTDGGMSFRADLEFHCRTKDVNQLYGMLVGQSEGGVSTQAISTAT